MHYKDLLEYSKKYFKVSVDLPYPGNGPYDNYMKNKNCKLWSESENITEEEIEKLFKGFITKWDRRFKGDIEKFKQVYKEIFRFIKELEHERIENINYEKNNQEKIRRIFNKVETCIIRKGFQSTDTSKIIHTIIPHLFVMWDDKIRKGVWKDKDWVRLIHFSGKDYAYKFMPLMQFEINEAIETFTKEENCTRGEAIEKISELGCNRSLAKLIDEYNWVKYTLPHSKRYKSAYLYY